MRPMVASSDPVGKKADMALRIFWLCLVVAVVTMPIGTILCLLGVWTTGPGDNRLAGDAQIHNGILFALVAGGCVVLAIVARLLHQASRRPEKP